MTTPPGTPIAYTRADFPGAVKEIAGIAGDVGGMPDLEGLLKFFERVVPLFERASKSAMGLRQWDADGRPQVLGSGESDVTQMDNPNQSAQNVSPAQTPQATGQITPIKVYQVALGAMNKLDPNMTIGKALEMGRANKDLIVAQIEVELANMTAE